MPDKLVGRDQTKFNLPKNYEEGMKHSVDVYKTGLTGDFLAGGMSYHALSGSCRPLKLVRFQIQGYHFVSFWLLHQAHGSQELNRRQNVNPRSKQHRKNNN